MNTMRGRSACLSLFAVFLTACASLPSDAPSFSAAPAPSSAYATVYFYRVQAYPKLRKPDVLVSGVKVFEPPELAYTWVHVKAGDRRIQVQWAWDTKWPPLDFTRPIEAGKSYYIKISGSFQNQGFQHVLGSAARLVPQEDAQRDLAGCCKYVKAEVQRVE